MRILFLLVVLFLLTLKGYSQVTNSPILVKDGGITKALSLTCHVLRQDFSLQDSLGRKFGIGNKLYFGRKSTIGISVEDRIYILRDFFKPWTSDSLFNEFKGEYTPLVEDLAIRPVYKDSFKIIKLHSDTSDFPIVALNAPSFKIDYDAVEYDAKSERGKLLVITTSEKEIVDTTKLYKAVYNVSVRWFLGKGILGKLSSSNIVGGAYFIEDISHGIIKYKLSGLLAKDENDNKYIVPIPKLNLNTSSNANASVSQSTNTQILTPINPSSKKRKRKRKKRNKKNKS